MSSRPHINLRTKLAATLCQLMHVNERGEFERIIPYEHAKMMSADQVIGLFAFDHGACHALNGSDEFWNLTPRLIAEHRKKTAEIDIPAIAKVKRLGRAHEEFVRKVLAKPCGHKRERSPRWPKGRKIASRAIGRKA